MRRYAAFLSVLPMACADGVRGAAADAGDTAVLGDAEQVVGSSTAALVMELPMPAPAQASAAAVPAPLPAPEAPVLTNDSVPETPGTVTAPSSMNVVAKVEEAAEPVVRGEIWASAAAEARLRRPGRWTGLAVGGARQDVLAVWSKRHVDVSVNDGATWTHALKSLRPHSGDSVAVANDGTLLVVGSGRRIGVRTVDGRERITVAPFVRRGGALFAGGGWTGWIGPSGAGEDDAQQLALSHDGGATWSLRDAPDRGNFVSRASLDADGTVAYYRASEWSCGGGIEELLVTPASGGAWAAESAAFDVVLDGVRGNDGWSYAPASACAEDVAHTAFCAWRGDEAIAVSGLTLPDDYDRWKDTFVGAPAATPANAAAWGAATAVVIIHHQLVLLTGAQATVVADEVPSTITVVAPDGAGRVAALADGHIFRWSKVGGWRLL